MAKFLTLFCLLAALFIGGSYADTCLSLPSSLGKGASCGGALPCAQAFYCSEEGICVSRAKEGEDCEDIGCEAGLQCKGPTDYKRCFASVHPGQACSASSSRSGPNCGTSSCSNSRCINGNLGDACYEDDDCSGDMTCTAGICTGLAIGATCADTSNCVVGAYCNFITSQCTTLPTNGNCSLSSTCAYGYRCIMTSADATFPQCIADGSLADGAYCGGQSQACMNLRCYQSHCAAASPKYCQQDQACAADEVCTCGGATITEGFGACTANRCTKLSKTYQECWSASCRSGMFFNGSCVQMNCEKEYLRAQFCGSASTLFVSFFSVSFFALFVSFLGKNF